MAYYRITVQDQRKIDWATDTCVSVTMLTRVTNQSKRLID